MCVCVAAGEQDAPGILPDPRFVPQQTEAKESYQARWERMG